ncbi:sporulation peptidase YabG [Hathewaya limosa]|uniref:Spore coat assembly protein n=1 Tax=Hathewaya limosa TaxID=1536 RepID=A0ABU0JMS1_HATLI|nr:sporulation peptidase YabG [Hathewaya limosa]AWZ49336.1 sporulation peptidase YabG [Clostridiaceae bacterium 14S0207]MDQ0478368.1 spore coat assembly protein [Hathewaya limosa]
MDIGDLVVRKSYGKDITFKIIDIKEAKDGKKICILKGVNLRIEADAREDDLEKVIGNNLSKADIIFNEKINASIRKVIAEREEENKAIMVSMSKKKLQKLRKKRKEKEKSKQREVEKIKEEQGNIVSKNLTFGRPGRILHVDGDAEYLEVCLKTYKQLSLQAVGRAIAEKDQPDKILEIVNEVKPDIVVITGHDGMIRHTTDYMDMDNYRNTKYFVETVRKLREYQSSYDELVIFAGACQSCYEAILDAGANFASSPNRVLIHCLDPVLVCEKIAYTNIEKIVPIKDVIENTITGIKGIGGLQTRGKYREGFPKSSFIK